MASSSGGEGLAALKAHLLKGAYKEQLSTLSDVAAYVWKCYPSLETQLVEIATEPGTGEAEPRIQKEHHR